MNKPDNRPYLLSRILSGDGVEFPAQPKQRVLLKTGSPVPYEDYAQKLQRDVDLVRQDWTRGTGRAVLFAVLPPIVFVALAVATSLFGAPDSFVYWLGKGLLLLVTAIVVLKLTFRWKQTIRSIIGRCYKEVMLTCPHCNEGIDLTRPWRCGWCGFLSNEAMLLSPNLVFDGCSHKGRHRPTALRCPHCSHDIIRDNPAYITEHKANSHGVAGVAEFVSP